MKNFTLYFVMSGTKEEESENKGGFIGQDLEGMSI